MELLQYDFMVRALLVGVLLAVIVPCIGVVVVLRRLSLIGDALSHASLAGVAAGLIMGINPVLGAVLTCVVAGLGIEVIRKRIPQYAELSIAVVLSAGVGLSGVLSGFVGSAANFNSFLFGSIVAISDFEMGLSVGISAVVIVLFLLLYRELFFLSLDPRAARLAGVPVRLVNVVFTVLTAVTVSIASRVIGALVVSSMMVVPVACALQVAGSYRQTVCWSVCFCVLFTLLGLTFSFYGGLRPGATIVLTGVGFLVLLLAGKGLIRRCLRHRGADREGERV